MKAWFAVLLSILLLPCLSLAEGTEAGVFLNPFLPVSAADMSVTDAMLTEDGAVAVHTGSVLSAPQADFSAGAALIRLKAAVPQEKKLTIRICLDDPESAPLATATLVPVMKEFRIPKAIEGIHDVYFVFEGEGSFISWQVFTSSAEYEAAIQAERSEVYEDAVPAKYTARCAHRGTIEHFTYTAHDYANDQEPYEKAAFVYLPCGYDPTQAYPLLILCHGIGGNEYEWGMTDDASRVKRIMDNLIDAGEIRPFIVVTPNGRAGRTSDYSSFYLFDQELRADLLPALSERYAVDIHDRSMCAMAGLSMGGMQTINLGIGKCLDLFSAFGAFSAAPTSSTAAVTASVLNASKDLPVRVFFSICGTEDSVALSAASAAVKNLELLTDQLDEDNLIVQYVPGGHDFGVWYLGFYNFARLFGSAF